MSHLPKAKDLDAQARAEARRADRMASRAPTPGLVEGDAEPSLFADQVVIGLIEQGLLIPLNRRAAVCEALGITDDGTVVAMQIEWDRRITLIRHKHTGRADGGHLTRESIPIIDTEETSHG